MQVVHRLTNINRAPRLKMDDDSCMEEEEKMMTHKREWGEHKENAATHQPLLLSLWIEREGIKIAKEFLTQMPRMCVCVLVWGDEIRLKVVGQKRITSRIILLPLRGLSLTLLLSLPFWVSFCLHSSSWANVHAYSVHMWESLKTRDRYSIASRT